LLRSEISEDFPWSVIQLPSDVVEVLLRPLTQVGALGEVLAEQWSGPWKLDT